MCENRKFYDISGCLEKYNVWRKLTRKKIRKKYKI